MKLEQKHNSRLFRIESDRFIEQGTKNTVTFFYLYIYSGDNCEQDYLENTIDACKRIAYENYAVPLNTWKEVK